MLLFFGLLLAFTLLVWPLLVLLHELGHAVPALMFTPARVAVYLGSYGDGANSWRMQVGRLEIYVKKWSLFWTGGLCVSSSSDMSKAQRVVMLLGGVLVTLAVAVVGFYGALRFDLHGSVKLYMSLLAVFATVTLITNLVPREHGGGASDGLLLKQLLTGDKLVTAFSPELQALIARSREVAIDLGYDYVSTLHLFLADCAMPYPYSLATVFFANAEAQEAFYEQHRTGPANPGAGSLPLTTEFERALQLTTMARRHGLGKMLFPAHLFLAASEVADSDFNRVAFETTALPQILLTHYRPHSELWAY
ncbi:hypothetical protein [Hymenobacter sp.]|uniref:hypothetical protein n=1 Tax=Hymenobacter sp. TaxID=1898978 RepID=UPI00286C893A|nr:hypothetical protein [Hymenobacter sp.]